MFVWALLMGAVGCGPMFWEPEEERVERLKQEAIERKRHQAEEEKMIANGTHPHIKRWKPQKISEKQAEENKRKWLEDEEKHQKEIGRIRSKYRRG